MLSPMRGAGRLSSALVLTGLAALGIAERAALHAHPLDENDLRPHQLALAQGEAECGQRAHLDAATLADHPICVECILAAAGLALAPSALDRLAGANLRALVAPTPARRAVAAQARVSGARGPPRA